MAKRSRTTSIRPRSQAARQAQQTRMVRVFLVIFSILLVVSMVLSLVANY